MTAPLAPSLACEHDLIAVARELIGGGTILSAVERSLLTGRRQRAAAPTVEMVHGALLAGGDPLGDAFCRIRSPLLRRASGATYTPQLIVDAMLDWAAGRGSPPGRIVDPGAGSGRFLMAAAGRFPDSRLVAIETDPLAALLLRANAQVRGFAHRLELRLEDYRTTTLSRSDGPTLFVGNPPYLRHHAIDEPWKEWFADLAATYGVKASKLAGLHIHFFLKTLQLGSDGDAGCFVTAAEWIDVNYGSVLRTLLADGLGGESLHVIDPRALPFGDAATTAAITCFRFGRRAPALKMRTVATTAELGNLAKGTGVAWEVLRENNRWSVFVRAAPRKPAGHIELGELFRVHRGQVTGCNAVWIEDRQRTGFPARFLHPAVTKARDLLGAGDTLVDTGPLRRVVDLPVDWEGRSDLSEADRRAIADFLAWARCVGADRGYIAEHRLRWYSVGLKPPAPVLCTYMARRPPAFVRNLAGARHINIAHGLYPHEQISEASLRRIVAWLRANVGVEAGRTYAGGLTKFEPGEIARLTIPAELLSERPHVVYEHQHAPPPLG